MSKFDIIIIGSGVGGLTAAAAAGVRGRRVLVLEAGKAVGGYLNPFRRGSYEFNPGLHYLGECGPGQLFTHLLETLGLADEIRFRELSPDGFDRFVFPEYEVAMPKGHAPFEARLAADFPHERQGLSKFFRLLQEFGHALTSFMEPPKYKSAARTIPPNQLFFKYGRMTFEQLLDGFVTDPLLKTVLAAQGGNYALPAKRASALIGLATLHHYLGGAYFPVGGSRAIRDALVRRIEQTGGEIKTRHTVEKIHTLHGRAHGVRCRNGEEFFAECIISNADPAVTYRDMVGLELLPARLRAQIERMRWSFGSICVFIGTDLDLAQAGLTDANIWCYPSVDIHATFTPLFAGTLPENHFYFLSSASLKNPPPEGAGASPRHTLEFVTLGPFEPFAPWAHLKSMKRGADYEALKEELAQRYLVNIERHVPGIRDHIQVLEVGTPATNVTYAAAPRGAAYGPELSPEQTGAFGYSLESAIPGLLFCGSSTLGTGVVFSAVSGFMAGELAATRGRY